MSEVFHGMTIPFLLAMFVAINMGGSGTAPAFSAAYGANVIRKSAIPGLFGIMVLAGALIAGKEVSLTLGNGILDQLYFTPFNTSVILFSVGATLLFANLIGVPQSTSQSTVLAIAGAACALDDLNYHLIFYEIIPTWGVLPLVSFVLMLVLSKWVFPRFSRQIVAADYGYLRYHKVMKGLLIFASLYVAFSIGANNVANAAAPIASLTINQAGLGQIENLTPIIILSVLIVAPCFAIGSSLLGEKGTEATGKEIVAIGPFEATVIALIVGSLLLLASVTKGIPTSLVQLNGGAFIALSISRYGVKRTFSNATVKRFFVVWGIAPAGAFFLTYVIILLAQ